jgi:enterobacteria phage integrase
MGRNRGGRFADRPENVEISTKGEVTYFTYVFPDGRRKGIGSSHDSAKAYDMARALNGHFAAQRVQLDLESLTKPRPMRASPRNPSIPALIEEFKRLDPKRKKYAEQTRENLDYALGVYARRWEARTVRDMETTDFASFLNELTDNAYVKNRGNLLKLMQFAGHQGYITTNPVAVTLVRGEGEKVRQRHTWAGIQQILDFKGRPAADGRPAVPATPDWMKRAIRVALYSLQRREDVVLLHKVHNKVDLERGTITILQRKTRNYRNPVWLEIVMGDELRAAVEDCMRSDVLCPYLIHYQPSRLTKKTKDAKPHPFAVTADYLTRTFREIRDLVGAYDNLTPECRPTIHELRGFGMHLYEQAGYSPEYIMALSGHATKSMYERYVRDHQQSGPKRVEAGLSVQQMPR